MMAARMLLVNALNLHPGELLIEATLLHSHRASKERAERICEQLTIQDIQRTSILGR